MFALFQLVYGLATPLQDAMKWLLDALKTTVVAPSLATAPPLVASFVIDGLIDGVGTVVSRRGYDPARLAASYEALDQTGNIATVSIGVVLEKVLAQEGPERVLALAFGPGMTLEWSILSRRDAATRA